MHTYAPALVQPPSISPLRVGDTASCAHVPKVKGKLAVGGSEDIGAEMKAIKTIVTGAGDNNDKGPTRLNNSTGTRLKTLESLFSRAVDPTQKYHAAVDFR